MSSSPAEASAPLTVALIGNPNTGKSTLFNALCGVRQRVGNYPGVTVEKKIGHCSYHGQRFQIVDLPGTYSLAPRSLDEMVAVDVLLGRRSDVAPPDVILSIVDASNLERNLYLVSQVLSLGRPTVIALNMTDIARERGIEIDVPELERRLGVRVIPIEAHRRQGLAELEGELAQAASLAPPPELKPFPPLFDAEVARLATALAANGAQASATALPRYLVERLLLDNGGYLQEWLGPKYPALAPQQLGEARERLRAAGYPVPAVEAIARYGWVQKALDGVLRRPDERRVTASDRIDRVLTNRWWGTLIFALLMVVVFQAVFTWAGPAMDWISGLCDGLGAAVEARLPEGAFRSLLVDGIIGGVGGVLVFLPQIFILFFFIAVLEDCGYMARAAYLMDRLMVRVGLSGKSFIPLLSSFACAIPGIMATRVIENRRDRLTTILIAPLMSCSARLPVYTLLIAAFIPARTYRLGVDLSDERYLGLGLGLQGIVMAAMYVVGIVVAVVVALLLKRTMLRGPTPPFVMELPSYKWPSLTTVLHRMFERGWAFIQRAGTLILAVSILVWAALYYPHPAERIEGPFAAEREQLGAQLATAPTPEQTAQLETELARIDHEILGAYQRQSFLGRFGQAIEPLVRPLGWDWRIGCAVLASFPAREVVVATLGVIYNLGSNVDLEDTDQRGQLVQALRQAKWDGTERPVYNVPVALSIMVFFALCAQCAATLAAIRRETNSWRWPAFTFAYMTGIAYVAAWATYQLGMLIGA
ncbi:MAG: ferrous iron transport protein B [Planctomycetaceae bacterium]|nr:ferrous iron transport protein B [Planctomycetaceae bacterium]